MYQYNNITISGIAGTGSTTLLNLLRDHLADDGWTGYSGGEYMKRFLPETEPERKGHHSAEDYGEDVDRTVDYSIREQLQTQEHLIIESWLSGFLAQGVPGVLKILLTCSNELDRAERLADRDNEKLEQSHKMTSAEAMVEAFTRLQENTSRWNGMYQDEWQKWVVDRSTLPAEASQFYWHPNLYDLVIDTAVYDPQSCLHLTIAKLLAAPEGVPIG